MRYKILLRSKCKGKNKRMRIELLQDKEGNKVFKVQTKTLVDFKKREFVEYENYYSVETFAILSEMFKRILETSKVKNKMILKELDQMNVFNAETEIDK